MEKKVVRFGKRIGVEQGDSISLPDGISEDLIQFLADVIEEYDLTLHGLK
ncbi:MAG: hypothetical protein K0Q90_1789 [Paenibacillaceae bacterium]|nr:hypothetical protein [Paenibacillaceae bacterium]